MTPLRGPPRERCPRLLHPCSPHLRSRRPSSGRPRRDTPTATARPGRARPGRHSCQARSQRPIRSRRPLRKGSPPSAILSRAGMMIASWVEGRGRDASRAHGNSALQVRFATNQRRFRNGSCFVVFSSLGLDGATALTNLAKRASASMSRARQNEGARGWLGWPSRQFSRSRRDGRCLPSL